ncbi:hypothetical protein FJT64_027732 [Amphibalanus amphitrite]|uniref:DUF7041 domain-containing protein n=1 Tax=Amphibalanus amphitrite TaxID=1232801 RepID=A0A6A4W7A1_AMPAM|nr:hypothetical protein FJT64_027732 [Amphibalanus amphitrite]
MPDATELDNAAPRGAPPATVSNGPPAETAQRPLASFRLPPYTPEEPDLWLLQVECAFDISGVSSDELRYKLLVANLPATIAVQVKDVIRTSRSFTALCDALKSRLAQSRADRLQSLLSRQQLGDQKPTALLRSMRNELAAAGDAPVDTELFRTLFKQRLPQPVRAALALLPADSALDALAEAADRYLDASGPDPRVAVVTAPPPQPATPAPAQPSAGLEAVVATLVAKMDSLQASHRGLEASNRRLQDALRRDRGRSQSRRRRAPSSSRPPTPARSPTPTNEDDLCWYHQRFGSRARRCESPCSWAEN